MEADSLQYQMSDTVIKTELNDDEEEETILPDFPTVTDYVKMEIKSEAEELLDIEPSCVGMCKTDLDDDEEESETPVGDIKMEIKSETEELLEFVGMSETEFDDDKEEESKLKAKSESEGLLETKSPCLDESLKLYDIQRLRKYGDVSFVIKRIDALDVSLSYSKAVSSVENMLEQLHRNNIPTGIGIAFRIFNHTPSSCILILGILNHKCHFFGTDKMMASKDLHEQMSRAGIEYLLVSGHMTVGESFFERLDNFLIYNEEYKLFKLKPNCTDGPPMLARTLPDNMCYTITTTGTTGQPKVIHVPYECISPNIVGLSEKLNVSMADIIYLGTPCTFDPFVVELFLAMQNGAAVLICHHTMRESPSKVLNALFPTSVTPAGITVLQMTPSLFRQFGTSAIRNRILNSSSTLRVLLLGGEPFPNCDELVTWMDPRVLLQKRVCNIYGITEISCWSLLHIVRTLQGSHIPLGQPIDDHTVVKMQRLKHLNTAELLLGSASRRTYIPELDDRMQGKLLKGMVFRATGDLVCRTEGNSIIYQDRSNDVVKRAGARISLGLITRKIERCLPSGELVTCLWQEQFQKLICCIRTLELKTKVQQRAQTFDILSKLSNCEQPDRFIYLQHFPCNSHGKLDKELLLKECTPLAEPAQEILKSFLHDRLEWLGEPSKPSSKSGKRQRLEKQKQLLNHPQGYELSFRQAGGTSFHAITLCREIGLRMCIDDEQRHLFEILLDENVPLKAVFQFLDTAKLVANNTKLKPLEPPLENAPGNAESSGSSNRCGLVIKRIEQPVNIHFQLHWKVNFNKCIDSPVAEYEGRYVCVGAHSKLLRTLDPRSGLELSAVKLPDRIECKVTFLSLELAVVGCYDGGLYAFNPLTGDIAWHVSIGGMIKAQPLLSADASRIVVCSYAEDYNVICISSTTQEVLWCLKVGEKPIFASPIELPYAQSVIISALDGRYTRVSLADGSVQWAQKCKEPIFSTPAMLDSNVFLIAEVAGEVHACHTGNGRILATFKADGNIFSSLVVKSPPTYMGQSFVVFGCIDRHVYCLRTKTTQPLLGQLSVTVSFDLHWKIDVGAPIYTTPTLINIQPSLIWSSTTDGRVQLMNFNNGEIRWSDKLPGEIFSTSCYIERLKRVYVGCRNNYLYCMGV
ncbi:beta-alanine-activating enzyme [Drosophila willistoni]|nr:beta-alanine-activating enzyme [Drosophila willistoni]